MTVAEKTKQELMAILQEVTEDCGYIGLFNGDDFLVLSFTSQEKQIEALSGMRIDDVMKELEMEYGYDDEYSQCGRCGEIIHTGDYGLPDYIIYGYEYVCNECIELDMLLDPDQESPYINNPRRALSRELVSESTLESEGFILLDEEYENGYYGTVDSPDAIFDKLSEKFEEVVFYISSSNPFATYFKVFVRGEK